MFRHNRFTVRAALVAFVLFLLPVFSIGSLKQGDRMPDLSSFKLEGRVPDKLEGRVVLLDFWASWCGPCKLSFPAMEKLNQEYEKKGLTIVAVSVDEKRENMEHFLKEMKVSFATVRDAQQKLVAAADVQAMPTSFLIDRTGKVRFVHDGFYGDQTVKKYHEEIEQLLKEGGR